MNDSSFSRIVGVLTSPTKTFEAISAKPTWAVVLVVMVALAVSSSFLMSTRIDVEDFARDAMAQSGRTMSEEQMQQAIDFQEKFIPTMMVAGPLVFGPIMYLVVALFFFVLFKLVGGELRYKQSFSTSLHSLVPWGVATLLNIPVILGRSEISYDDVQRGGNLLKSNLGFLAGEDASTAVSSLLSSIDLFSIWTLILFTLGFSIVGKVSRQKAAVVVIALWVVYVVGKTAWTAAFA